MPFQHQHDLIGRFAQHRVAANLLMLMMLLAGVFALAKLNTQFFPSFALEIVTVRVAWSGASAEDVETSITNPIERELRTLDNLRKLTSTSSEGAAAITLEYEEGTDMGTALDQVKERVALIRNLPATSEEPEISRFIRYEPVARILVSADVTSRDLRALVRTIERDLLDRGIAKVTIDGLPDEEIAIEVSPLAAREMQLSLDDIATRIGALSRDVPAGTIGRNDVARQLRALDQRRRAVEFEQLPLIADEDGRLVRLGDVAVVERRARALQTHVYHRGKPAVELLVSRAESGDSLQAAGIVQSWHEDVRGRLPPGVEVFVYDESWRLIKDRISLLLKNGGGGLVLVVLILYLFLNTRVAFWVAVGIPTSFMAALGVLYLVGGSINMISLFAMIMTLGIIVDDAIVVGEDALAHYQAGEDPLQASEGGARRMLAPVISSSLTTVAAFLPLMLVSGIIGNILFDIPLVAICVIAASLVESFLILPGHLRHAFVGAHHAAPGPLRAALDRGFERFRDGPFRRLATLAVGSPMTVLAGGVATLAICLGLLAGGRLDFVFFPTAETTVIRAGIGFVAGTPPERVHAFATEVQRALYATEQHFGEDLVVVSVERLGVSDAGEGRVSPRGDQFSTITVELTQPDDRETRNGELIRDWRSRIALPAGIEAFSIVERRGGPPGRDVEVRLTGGTPAALKNAALDLQAALENISGVTGTDDDMPYGKQQLVYKLTAQGRALGLTVDQIGRQLRAAYDGWIAQIFQDGDDELEVRVVLPDSVRHELASLERVGIQVPSGETVPLLSVVDLEPRRGFEVLRHAEGELAVQVSADVDPAVANGNAVIAQLQASVLPALQSRYGIDFSFEGRAADQRETFADMRTGMLFAAAMIYLVLAWVFASYAWPLVVMFVIPFGLAGAIFGHWLLGIDLTILSLFGLFGLSGIVVNDSIILVVFYKQLRAKGGAVSESLVEAACQRLRAVLLTSLTTIAGLAPLLFETSLQAQFLIPMAVSISFGLAFSTLLVLFLVPALLRLLESFQRGVARLSGRAPPSVAG